LCGLVALTSLPSSTSFPGQRSRDILPGGRPRSS
jgi:hypothetical protein